ncbi:MAG: DMT family transporter [Actinomycetes bacterium]
MAAVLGGLGAAVCWAIATICGSRSSRIAGSAAALGWIALLGLLAALPIFAFNTTGIHLTASTWGWLLLTGAGNMVGLFFEYQGFRRGPVGVVASIASTEGAIAVGISYLLGERPPLALLLVLPILLLGLVLVTLPSNLRGDRPTNWLPTILFGAASGLTFGVGLYATGKVGGLLPAIWSVMPSRIIGILVLTIPLGLAGKLRVPRATYRWLVAGGVSDVGGFLCFATACRHGIALPAVLASQFAVLATVGVAVLFHERISRRQTIGAVLVALGVAAVAGARAMG